MCAQLNVLFLFYDVCCLCRNNAEKKKIPRGVLLYFERYFTTIYLSETLLEGSISATGKF